MRKLFFTASLCTGCRACEVACSFKKEGIFSPALSRIRVVRLDEEGLDIPTGCEHCEDAPCIRICPVRALKRRPETGAVVVDGDRCIGCKQCMVVCPFGAVHFSHASGRIFKCDLCDGDPECVKWCFTGAVSFCEEAGVPRAKRHRFAHRHMALTRDLWSPAAPQANETRGIGKTVDREGSRRGYGEGGSGEALGGGSGGAGPSGEEQVSKTSGEGPDEGTGGPGGGGGA
ncbi:MAG: 4Fe-4S dicluster domain-containing protein [Thermoplasmata archaeon]